MGEQPRFQPGQTILLREIWHNQVWSARSEIVVEDKPELMAFFMPAGTIWKQPKALDGSLVTAQHRFRSEWLLRDVARYGSGRLRLTIAGTHYSVYVPWNAENSLRQWYINLEDPKQRTELGFDYIDQMLDITAVPDLTNWQWKDEDEFDEAVSLGL